MLLVWGSEFYYQQRVSKLAYMSTRKVLKLLEEQQTIFNKLPDGALIHKTQRNISSQKNKNI